GEPAADHGDPAVDVPVHLRPLPPVAGDARVVQLEFRAAEGEGDQERLDLDGRRHGRGPALQAAAGPLPLPGAGLIEGEERVVGEGGERGAGGGGGPPPPGGARPPPAGATRGSAGAAPRRWRRGSARLPVVTISKGPGWRNSRSQTRPVSPLWATK